MNVCIVYEAQQGNGKRVAEILGTVFEQGGASVIISHVDKLAASEVPPLARELLRSVQ